ncbi:MAG: glutamine--fructose-6-phosphate transaminase (isomerizing) [Sphaerochaetaceae bacterium]|jgi:glucosamine--fructose-6-phosphate aminotransferase (isomerizing)
MCGIVGYIGTEVATPLLLDSLKKLEYRGYDSAGIAVLAHEGLVVRKAKGRLTKLEQLLASEAIDGTVGIGHTRWATHGEPSDINSHPHTDVSGNIAIVHNGIIENHAKLRDWLEKHGVTFRSQTDSEVIAHLIDFHYNGDLLQAVRETMARIEGSYALGVLSEDAPDRIIAARKDSPLVIGYGKTGNYIASDVPALLAHTREVTYIDDYELAVLFADHVEFYTEDGDPVQKEICHIEWDVEAAEKGGYEHFMLKEMHEQPKALTDTIRPRIIRDESSGLRNVDMHEVKDFERWKAEDSRIFIVACGTAWHAGIVGKYIFEQFARIPVEVDIASEFRYRNPLCGKNDIFIIISQSGETADTLAAMRLAKRSGAEIVAITNVVGSTLSREADSVLYTWAGPEIAVASTKAFTTQLSCLYLIALKLGNIRGVISHQQLDEHLKEIERIPAAAAKIFDMEDELQRFAARHFNKTKVFFMGRLFDYAISMESALKLKEISYTHSEAFAAGELKHGPIALVDTSTLVVAFCTQRALFEKMDSNMKEVKARGATVLAITFDDVDTFDGTADETLKLPVVLDQFSPMLSIIPCQLYAYYCSILRGNDPDKPRNLAKSVTVE